MPIEEGDELGAPPRVTELASRDGLREALRGRGPLYAVLDAARDAGILPLLRASDEPFVSLYAGRRARRLADVAPYLALVSTEAPTPILDALAHRGWGQCWGILLEARVPLDELRHHLRRWITVETEDGEALVFRFYDPRVARPFLASSTASERAAFLGPATSVLVEEGASRLLSFDRVGPERPRPRAPFPLPRVRARHFAAFTAALAREPPPDHGFDTPADRDRFGDLERALGRGFHEQPWARSILAREDLAPPQKLARLERWVRQHRTKP